MRGITGWHYHPYRPASSLVKARLPYICRLAPKANQIELEWFDRGDDGPHHLLWRAMDTDQPWSKMPLTGAVAVIKGLKEGAEYELQVIRAEPEEGASDLRFARCGQVPGTVIHYLHPRDPLYDFSGRALCSPSLCKTPSGGLLASMDLYAPERPQNLTLLFRSDDGGASWRYVNDLFPCYWGALFVHQGLTYILGCTTEYGDLLIGVSRDEGETWSKPVRLFPGSCSPYEEGWQHTPMPILRAHGRLYTSVDYGAWKTGGHAIGTLWIDENDDLMQSENWNVSRLTAYDPHWPGAPQGNSGGLLEGNMLLGRDGRLLNLLRLQMNACTPAFGRAVLLEADPEDLEKAPSFHRIIPMPSGGNSKTHVVYDQPSGMYVAIGNICTDPATPGQRNVLALLASENVYDWRVAEVLLDYRHEDPGQVGFQYISFIIDGEDIFYQSRTSLNGARNFHDANYATFHRIPRFRDRLRPKGKATD